MAFKVAVIILLISWCVSLDARNIDLPEPPVSDEDFMDPTDLPEPKSIEDFMDPPVQLGKQETDLPEPPVSDEDSMDPTDLPESKSIEDFMGPPDFPKSLSTEDFVDPPVQLGKQETDLPEPPVSIEGSSW